MGTTDMTQKAFMVRIQPGGGPGDQVPNALHSDHIMVGWSAIPELLERTLDREGFRLLMRAACGPKVRETQLGKWVGDAWRFIREMRVGDLVVVPHGVDVYIAEVTGDAYYDGTFVHLDTAIRRSVRFAKGKRPIPRCSVSLGLQKTLHARQTCIELRVHLPEVRSLAGIG